MISAPTSNELLYKFRFWFFHLIFFFSTNIEFSEPRKDQLDEVFKKMENLESEIKDLTKSRKPGDLTQRPQYLPIDIEPMQGEPTFFNFYIRHQQTIKVKFSN